MTAQRILHILPWVASGGVERRRLLLAKHLEQTHFTQALLCKSAHEPLREPLLNAGCDLIELPGSWGFTDLDNIHRALQIVDAFKPQIIHGAVFEGVVFAALIGYLARVPHILIEETGATPHRSWRGDLIMTIAAALAERCIAVSPHVGRYLSHRSRIPEQKLHIITNGVAFPSELTAQERRAARAALSLPDDALVIGSVGRLFDGHKRFSTLIDAIALGPAQLHLVIVGRGPDEQRYRDQIDALGLTGRVILAGHHAKMDALYGAMDVFAIASAYEAFGLVIPEAMSVGLPTIGTRVDAIPDIIEDGVTGLLVPPNDPRALAEAMCWMLEHPAQRAAMGAAGRARAHAEFHETRYVRDVRALYQRLGAEVTP